MFINLLLEEKKDGFISTGLELILLLKEKKNYSLATLQIVIWP